MQSAAGFADHAGVTADVMGDQDAPFDDLAGLIADAVEPFVLVLDDVHHLNSDESASLIDRIIEQLPPHSTLVLVGRPPPTTTDGRRLQATGVVDVTADDLAFDVAESEEMLTGLASNAISTC